MQISDVFAPTKTSFKLSFWESDQGLISTCPCRTALDDGGRMPCTGPDNKLVPNQFIPAFNSFIHSFINTHKAAVIIKYKNTQSTLWFKKNAPTSADYNYDPVQSILIIFSKLFDNDHKSCLVVKFSTSPHICCHYTL